VCIFDWNSAEPRFRARHSVDQSRAFTGFSREWLLSWISTREVSLAGLVQLASNYSPHHIHSGRSIFAYDKFIETDTKRCRNGVCFHLYHARFVHFSSFRCVSWIIRNAVDEFSWNAGNRLKSGHWGTGSRRSNNLANVNSRSRWLYAIARPSVCLSSVSLSVTLVRPTQAVQIFRNISTALGTLPSADIHWKFHGDRSRETLRRGS